MAGRRNDDGRLGEVTKLLQRWKDGDAEAVDKLFHLVYQELRAIAQVYLSRERPGHTLSGTALVHEAYLRLSKIRKLDINDRSHFFSIAARAMRRILVDHARSRLAGTRIGPNQCVTLIDQIDAPTPPPETVIAVDQLLDRLRGVNERAARVVELRFFGGLSELEAAEVLGTSRSSMSRDWKFARIWMLRQLLG